MNILVKVLLILSFLFVSTPIYAENKWFYGNRFFAFLLPETFEPGNFSQGIVFMRMTKSKKLLWQMRIFGLEGITMAHIHCKSANGGNGPVGVSLIPENETDWSFVRGSISVPNEGNPCGWESLEDVKKAIKMNQAYVNVHTTEMPAGAIRGDLLTFGLFPF